MKNPFRSTRIFLGEMVGELQKATWPTKAELRKFRGVNSIYHNNGIQTWHLHKNGEVENVEVS